MGYLLAQKGRLLFGKERLVRGKGPSALVGLERKECEAAKESNICRRWVVVGE